MSAPDVPETTLAAARQLLARRVGFRISPSVVGRLSRSVADEAAAHQLEMEAYEHRLATDPVLLQGLVDRVTVQETSFFRDPGQLEAFRTHVLPTLSPKVRIWSAGCSNGQEPYTLAMLLAESGVVDWEIIATDLSTPALERTRRAQYSDKEVAGVAPALRARYLQRVGPRWEVAGALRERVTVERHNLTDPPPFEPGQRRVVFCRNVLIYFEADAIVSTIERLARWLRRPSWLFLGYSESLRQLTDEFVLARVGKSFAYCLPAQQAPVPAAPPRTGAPPPASPRPLRPSRPLARRPAPAASPADPAAALLAAGEDAMNAGDIPAAVIAFRKYAYLEPEQPFAHLHLGLALEAAGDAPAARRAFAVARAAIERGDKAQMQAGLDGYSVDELARLLDAKLAGP